MHANLPRMCAMLLALSIGGTLAAPCRAGFGRQTLTVEADYGYAAVCRWIEQNVDAIQQNPGAKILAAHGDVITVQCGTKYGMQTFRIRRTDRRGDYRAVFVDRSAGTLTDY